jgi:hypothetical protein
VSDIEIETGENSIGFSRPNVGNSWKDEDTLSVSPTARTTEPELEFITMDDGACGEYSPAEHGISLDRPAVLALFLYLSRWLEAAK